MIKALTQARCGEVGPNYKDVYLCCEGLEVLLPVKSKHNPHIVQIDQNEKSRGAYEVMFQKR